MYLISEETKDLGGAVTGPKPGPLSRPWCRHAFLRRPLPSHAAIIGSLLCGLSGCNVGTRRPVRAEQLYPSPEPTRKAGGLRSLCPAGSLMRLEQYVALNPNYGAQMEGEGRRGGWRGSCSVDRLPLGAICRPCYHCVELQGGRKKETEHVPGKTEPGW